LLLDYSTTTEEEAQMQFFFIGQWKKSLYAMGKSLVTSKE